MKSRPVVLLKTTVLHHCKLGMHEDCPQVLTTVNGNKIVCLCKCHNVLQKGSNMSRHYIITKTTTIKERETIDQALQIIAERGPCYSLDDIERMLLCVNTVEQEIVTEGCRMLGKYFSQ